MKKELVFKAVVSVLAGIGAVASVKEVVDRIQFRKWCKEEDDLIEEEMFHELSDSRSELVKAQESAIDKTLAKLPHDNTEYIKDLQYSINDIEVDLGLELSTFNEPLDIAYTNALKLSELYNKHQEAVIMETGVRLLYSITEYRKRGNTSENRF